MGPGVFGLFIGLLMLTPFNAAILTVSSPNAQPNGLFGLSVASSNGLVVVGAHRETVNGIIRAGRAYVFSVTDGSLVNSLISQNPQGDGEFGNSVALATGNIIVSAPYEAANRSYSAGEVYVF